MKTNFNPGSADTNPKSNRIKGLTIYDQKSRIPANKNVTVYLVASELAYSYILEGTESTLKRLSDSMQTSYTEGNKKLDLESLFELPTTGILPGGNIYYYNITPYITTSSDATYIEKSNSQSADVKNQLIEVVDTERQADMFTVTFPNAGFAKEIFTRMNTVLEAIQTTEMDSSITKLVLINRQLSGIVGSYPQMVKLVIFSGTNPETVIDRKKAMELEASVVLLNSPTDTLKQPITESTGDISLTFRAATQINLYDNDVFLMTQPR